MQSGDFAFASSLSLSSRLVETVSLFHRDQHITSSPDMHTYMRAKVQMEMDEPRSSILEPQIDSLSLALAAGLRFS